MRPVFFPDHGTRFRPDVASLAVALPEVTLVEISFLQPSPDEPEHPSDYAQHVRWHFRNATTLSLSGTYFWKFLASAPPELCDKAGNWLAAHPHGEGSAESLMAQLRAAYDTMFLPEPGDTDIRAPLRAKLDLVAKQAHVEFPASVEPHDWSIFMTLAAPERSAAEDRIAQHARHLIIEGLNAPRAVMEPYDVPGGMIGQRHAYAIWEPDSLTHLSLDDFLDARSVDDSDGHPWRPTFRVRLSRFVDEQARRVLVDVFPKLRADAPEVHARMSQVWGVSAGANDPDRLVKAFSESRERQQLTEVLQGHFLAHQGTSPLRQVLGEQVSSIRMLTASEITQPRSENAEYFHALLGLVGESIDSPADAARIGERCLAATHANGERLRDLLIYDEVNLETVNSVSFAMARTTPISFPQLTREFVAASPVTREEYAPFRALLWTLLPGRCHDLTVPAVAEARENLNRILQLCYQVEPPVAEVISEALFLTRERLRARLEGTRYECLSAGVESAGALIGELVCTTAENNVFREGLTVRQLLDQRFKTAGATRAWTGWTLIQFSLAQRQQDSRAHSYAQSEWQARMLSSRSSRSSSQPVGQVTVDLFHIKCALVEELADHFDRSVREMVSLPTNEDGFFQSFYGGSPQEVVRLLCDRGGWYSEGVKTVVSRESLGAHFLSVFRLRRHSEERGERIYEVEAVLHDAADTLVAKVGFVLAYFDPDMAPSDVAWSFDAIDQDDAREAGLALAQALDEGHIDLDLDLPLRVMFVRDWEVRQSDRGKGLGRALLEASVPLASRGLPRPQVLMANVHPAQLTVYPQRRESSQLPLGLGAAFSRLAAYWDEVIGPGSPLGDRFQHHLSIQSNRQCYASDGSVALQSMARAAVAMGGHL